MSANGPDTPSGDVPALGGATTPGEGAKLRLGGMALRNGLLVHGPTCWAAAIRTPAGELRVASGRKPTIAPRLTSRLPVIRGPLRLAEAMAVIPLARMRLRDARLPVEEPRFAAAAAFSLLSTGLARSSRLPDWITEPIATVAGIVPAMAAMRSSELAAYHAAEHKQIAAYESGRDPADEPKEHERCGSNLVGPMMATTLLAQVILERSSEKPGPAARALAAFGAAGVAVEVFAYAERHPNAPLARLVHRSGHEIQARFVTREPTSSQLEVGGAAVGEVLRLEGT